jgi:hypothetical protein
VVAGDYHVGVRARTRRLAEVSVCSAVFALLVPAVGGSFTGTPAALKLVRAMRAAIRDVPAVRQVRTGAVVYCPSVPQGWTYAPQPGCPTRARVSEEYDLSHGKVTRILGDVTAPLLPTLRYVDSPLGWYQTAAGLSCWDLKLSGFTVGPFVDFPLRAEHLTIIARTKRKIVLQGIATQSAYRELDYINPSTDFAYRVDEITSANHKSYRVTDHLTKLTRPTPPVSTPTCK